MNIVLKRDYFPNYTYGVWYKDDLPVGLYSIELPNRNNEKFVSCILPGTYLCTLYNSPNKGLVYLLQNVLNHDKIEIHKANWTSDLLGCIGVGTSFGVMLNPKTGVNEAAILNSSAGLAKLMAITDNKEFTLTIM